MNALPPIVSDEQHAAFLAEVETLMLDDPAPNTPAGHRLNVLADVIVEYERRRWPMFETS